VLSQDHWARSMGVLPVVRRLGAIAAVAVTLMLAPAQELLRGTRDEHACHC
jgi:hypothetical protein